ncbi:MAG: zinc ribbon domain-containing protein [Promethearchaeota archaeon]
MPRGGGSFGGGFKGGGSIGFGGGFRSGGFGTSTRPFGRTGANRIVNRPLKGPYSHSYYRRYRLYYGYRWGYYRPWYFSPFWGYYYRPWYRAPIFIGGGIILAIILSLIILPIAGIAIAYPFDNADSSGNVIYRDTQTLYFNEYWYEYEYIKAGHDITFSLQSTPSFVTFIIDDEPFWNLPTTTKISSEIDNMILAGMQYQYIQIFLKYGSKFQYEFSSSGPVSFFISDGENLNKWVKGQSSSFYVEKTNTNNENGEYYVYESQDYYIVWANYGSSSVNINYNITYHAANVIDTSKVDYAIEKTKFIPETVFKVPTDGEWYFFIYFDPLNAPEESTTITFDVKYETGVTSIERWASIRPVLIGFVIFIGFLILIGATARSVQKKNKDKLKKQQTQQPQQIQQPRQTQQPQQTQQPSNTTPASSYGRNCLNCGEPLTPSAIYCPNCGKKVEGRAISKTNTVPMQKFCKLCGNELSPTDKFCTECGAKIK